MVEKKAFHANPKHQYCISQCREHDCSAHKRKNGDYHVYPTLSISWTNIDYKENGKKKSFFLENPIINIVYTNEEIMIVVPIIKGMEIIMSIQLHLISRMNLDYKEDYGKKSFSCKSKASIPCIPMRRT